MSDHFDQARVASTTESGEGRQYLTFSVADSEYAVDIMAVREIKGWTETTRLPNTPDYMRGVINLRGLIIPIFDLRTRFGKGTTEADAKHVVIILAVGDRNIGILVDAVSDILTVYPSQVKRAPKSEGDPANAYISGLILIEERMVVQLDIDHVFEPETVTAAA